MIGGVIYALGYYFFFANKGGYNYGTNNSTTYGSQAQTQPAPQNSNPAVSNQPVPPAPSAKTVNVTISNFAFSPREISVKAGTKVTWTNNDSTAHTVTSNTGAFDSGTLNSGASYSFVFNTPGTFNYRCMIHPSMMATVVVAQ